MADFRFANLLGAPYRGGTLLLHGNTLLSPVGNRVTQARSRRNARLMNTMRPPLRRLGLCACFARSLARQPAARPRAR
jgi:hypothetical protein